MLTKFLQNPFYTVTVVKGIEIMQKRVHNVFVIEPNDIVRSALVDYLEICDEFQPVGSAVNGQEAIRECPVLKPDIILTEFKLPDIDGIEAIEQLHQHCPDTPIVVFTFFRWTDRMREAIEAGATGWLEKGITVDRVVDALQLATRKLRHN
jgi:DNA-binding NarL/FixJ family response regulator